MLSCCPGRLPRRRRDRRRRARRLLLSGERLNFPLERPDELSRRNRVLSSRLSLPGPRQELVREVPGARRVVPPLLLHRLRVELRDGARGSAESLVKRPILVERSLRLALFGRLGAHSLWLRPDVLPKRVSVPSGQRQEAEQLNRKQGRKRLPTFRLKPADTRSVCAVLRERSTTVACARRCCGRAAKGFRAGGCNKEASQVVVTERTPDL